MFTEPLPPEGLVVSYQTTETMYLQWQQDGGVTDYIISINPPDDDWTYAVDVNDRTAILYNLTSGGCYNIVLQPVSGVVTGEEITEEGCLGECH